MISTKQLFPFVLLVAAILSLSQGNLPAQIAVEIGLVAPTKEKAIEGDAVPKTISAPVFGHIWRDDLQVAESIVGLPGALSRGPQVDFGQPLYDAWLGAAQNRGLGVALDDGEVLLLDPLTSTAQPIDGVSKQPDGIRLSPLGRSAALLYERTATIEVLTDLGGTPKASIAVDLTDLSGELRQWAVTDDGKSLLLASEEGDLSTLHHLREGGFLALISTRQSVSDVRFLPNSLDALVADEAASEVIRISGLLSEPIVSVIAGQEQGITAPQALAAIEGGRRAVVLSRESSTIHVLDLLDNSVEPMDCSCRTDGVYSHVPGHLFRLSEARRGSVAFLEADEGSQRILLVPAQSLTIKIGEPPPTRRSPRARTFQRN